MATTAGLAYRNRKTPRQWGPEPDPRRVRSWASELEICNWWLGRIAGPYRVESERWWAFRGGIRNFDVAALNISDIRLSDGRVIRDNRSDGRYRGDCYYLVFQVEGVARMCQRGNEAVLHPGDCTLIDSRLPSVFHIGEGIHQYSFNFPVALVDARLAVDSGLICRRIPGANGAGTVLADLLRSIVRNRETLGGADLRETTIDMLAAATGRADAGAANGPIQRSTVSVRDVISYVDARAHDVLLTPHHLAAHFNVSLRRLYRITAAANCTPSALIWERRLLRAHELLGRSRELPITEVAFSCGFKNSAHFSRAYRRTFGQTPSATRRACLESLARRDTPQFALSRHAS